MVSFSTLELYGKDSLFFGRRQVDIGIVVGIGIGIGVSPQFFCAPIRAQAKKIVASLLIFGSPPGGYYNHPARSEFHEKPLPANDVYAGLAEGRGNAECVIFAFEPSREVVITFWPYTHYAHNYFQKKKL